MGRLSSVFSRFRWNRGACMRLFGLLGLVIVAAVVGLLYKSHLEGLKAAGVATPTQTVDIVGVKNDLIGIAQAERAYQAENGKYTSLGELVSSGALRMEKTGRAEYTYEVTASEQDFRAVAHCPAATFPGCTNLSIDQTMEIQTAP